MRPTHFILLACCYFLSPVLNPFLYCLLSKRFRRGFHDLKQKVHGWWEANIWSSQSSSSQESSYRANFVARPFLSLPNPPDPSYYQMREEKKSSLICKTDVPRATSVGTPQVAVEMLSIANNVQEENDIEMTSSNNSIDPNLCIFNDSQKNQSSEDETGNSDSHECKINMKWKCKSNLFINQSKSNNENFLLINNSITVVSNKSTIDQLSRDLHLHTIKRTRSLINFTSIHVFAKSIH